MSIYLSTAIATLLLFVNLLHTTSAAEFLVGQRVIAIRDSQIQMSTNDMSTVTIKVSTGAVFLIEKIESGRLLIREQSWTGWVDAANVADFDRGFTIMSGLIDSGRATHRIYDGRGRIYMQRGAYVEALADLTIAIRLQPSEPDHLINRGICHIFARNLKVARADFDRCLDLLNGSTDTGSKASAFYHRGLTHFSDKNWQAAIADFDAAIEQNPHEVFAVNRRGMAWRQVKQHVKALNDFDQAIILSPDFIAPHNYRGLVLWELGRYPEAVQSFEKAIALAPNTVFVLGTISHDLFRRISESPNPPLSDYWNLDAELAPYNNLARLLMTCPESFRDLKRASELVEKIKSQDHGRYYEFMITEAMLLKAQKKEAESNRLLQLAAIRAPDRSAAERIENSLND